MRLRTLALSIALLALPLPLLADTVYTYTGNPFTSVVQAGFTTSDFISGSFTISSPLGANLPLTSISPVAFSFFDGVDTISNTTPNAYGLFQVGTDATGDVTSWSIFMQIPGSNIAISSTNTSEITEDGANTTQSGSDPNEAYNKGDPGTWSSNAPSPVPEPSTLLMLATGLGGAFVSLRRRLLS